MKIPVTVYEEVKGSGLAYMAFGTLTREGDKLYVVTVINEEGE